ncbi:MAG: hypothetical protein H6980_03620 [Gammaproteobacteria bacterium]|nr:hypothetical protein [Gammaproteobacteria bacterium]
MGTSLRSFAHPTDWLGAAATVLVLGLLSLVAAFYIARLPEVSDCD